MIVNAKVHGLKEIFNRLDRRTYPLPTGNDVANYLKWFQHTLQRYFSLPLLILGGNMYFLMGVIYMLNIITKDLFGFSSLWLDGNIFFKCIISYYNTGIF